MITKKWQTSERKYNITIERDVSIPMSDGISVDTDIFQPDSSNKFPAILGVHQYEKALQCGPVEERSAEFNDGGGRLVCDLTDCDPEKIEAGAAVEMTFRKLYQSKGINSYFWKAKPIAEGDTKKIIGVYTMEGIKDKVAINEFFDIYESRG
jgi:hypothetical protein